MLVRWQNLLTVATVLALGVEVTPSRSPQEDALLQTWEEQLDGNKQGASAPGTPISRVVGLLQEMVATMKKEMDEDEELYDKLRCWCNNNAYEKNQAIEAAEAKIADLTSTIEALTAKTAELKILIDKTTTDLADDKEALAVATETRNKQLKEFHGVEVQAIQNIENLKTAIMVLSRHHGAFPQLSLFSLRSRHKSTKRKSSNPFGEDHEGKLYRQFDDFVSGFEDHARQEAEDTERTVQKFLQDSENPPAEKPTPIPHQVPGWTADEKNIVERAMHSANGFLQAQGKDFAMYAPKSGQILGVMKQLKDEMEADLSEASKTEMSRATGFAELREAKTNEIAAGEALLEKKTEELAQDDMDLAHAKEDLEEYKASLSEDQKFMINLKKTCSEADTNFEARKKARLSEIQAVGEAINILTADEAKDTFNGAYGKFIQLSSKTNTKDSRRKRAAKVLMVAGAKSGNPDFSVLATSVQLDAFTKVKELIDEMISKLKVQQQDEVKKKDFCDSEFQENTMMTKRAETKKSDQTVQIESLASTITTLTDELSAAKTQIQDFQLNLQRASENRQKENLEFQRTVADQAATREILAKALDKLATFYDLLQVEQNDSLVQFKLKQEQAHHGKQTPPVPQMEYKPSAGASGAMSMIEKLIYDAKELTAEAVKSESEAQAQYETLVEDTNASVHELQEAVVQKTEAKAEAEKAKTEAEEMLEGTLKELEGLSAYVANLHEECDYIMKNFNTRQEARAQEIEALQQAKSILSGALS
jgi:hypothetical protein